MGRPARVWQLTAKANDRFPDRHTELAVGMLEAVRNAFGEEGIERLTDERTNRPQAERNRSRLLTGRLPPQARAPLTVRPSAAIRVRAARTCAAQGGEQKFSDCSVAVTE